MQIKINLKIFIFIFVFILTRQIELYAILMMFAVLHELAHLFAGMLLGLKPKQISIMPLGLTVSFQVNCKEYNQKLNKGNKLALKKIAIAIAGPFLNLFLAIIGILYCQGNINLVTSLWGVPIDLMVYSNILIFLFNLLPIYPLDGGRVLKQIIHIAAGLQTAYEYTNKISNITMIILTALASVAILAYHNVAILFIIIYLWVLVIQQNKQYQLKRNIYDALQSLPLKKVEQSIEKEYIS